LYDERSERRRKIKLRGGGGSKKCGGPSTGKRNLIIKILNYGPCS